MRCTPLYYREVPNIWTPPFPLQKKGMGDLKKMNRVTGENDSECLIFGVYEGCGDMGLCMELLSMCDLGLKQFGLGECVRMRTGEIWISTSVRVTEYKTS